MSGTTLRSTAVTARVGMMLGIAVTLCFVTGLISHFIQHPQPWFYWPAHPVWLYRLTQGTHVASGIAAIPLTVVKLWSVWPKLFERPIIGGVAKQLERASILVLVGAMLFELSTGLLNIAQWYVFKFFFTTSHYAVAYLAAGAVLVHIAVKLPVIRRALGEPLGDVATGGAVGPTRRSVLWGTGVAVAVATLATAGQSVGWLRELSLLSPRSGKGPQGIPVNRTAIAAGVLQAAASPAYRLTIVNGADQTGLVVNTSNVSVPGATFSCTTGAVAVAVDIGNAAGTGIRSTIGTKGRATARTRPARLKWPFSG